MIFSFIIPQKIENYIVFLLLGIILWNFFVEATSISMHNMISKKDIIKAIYFDRHALVISSNFNALLTLGFNMLIFIIFMIILRVGFQVYFPIFFAYIILLFILSLGVSFILAGLYVKYRDIVHVWEVVVQLLFWLTPIVYSVTSIPQKYLAIYMLNPLARIFNDSRNIVIYHQAPDWPSLLLTFIVCVIVYVIGYYIYKRQSRYFAEEL